MTWYESKSVIPIFVPSNYKLTTHPRLFSIFLRKTHPIIKNVCVTAKVMTRRDNIFFLTWYNGFCRIGVVSGKAIFGPPLEEYWRKKLEEEAAAKENNVSSASTDTWLAHLRAFFNFIKAQKHSTEAIDTFISFKFHRSDLVQLTANALVMQLVMQTTKVK